MRLFELWFSLGIGLVVWLLGHMVVLAPSVLKKVLKYMVAHCLDLHHPIELDCEPEMSAMCLNVLVAQGKGEIIQVKFVLV